MPGETTQTFAVGGLETFPRFLAREAQAGGPIPPPIPRLHGLRRAVLKLAAKDMPRVWHGLAAACLSSLSLLATVNIEHDTRFAAVHATPPLIRALRADGADRGDVESLQERLGYAAHLGHHLAQRHAGLSTDATLDDAIPAPAPLAAGDLPQDALDAEEDRTIALLIVREVPGGATFSHGAQAGIGAWAIGAQDPAELALAIAHSPLETGTASIEMISAAGVSIETRSAQLHKRIDMAPPVAAALEPRVTVADAAAAGKPPATERRYRRKSAAGARKAFRLAQDERKAKRRARRAEDAYRAEKAKEQAAEDDEDNAAQKRKDEEPGTVAKMFNWLKGSGSSATQQAQDAPQPPSRTPLDESSMSGLGMFQQ